jgi:4a-hydroxytetrahydrobiopterin dehydratase
MALRDPLDADGVQARLAERPGWTGDTAMIAKTIGVNHDNIPKIFADVWQAADDLEHHPDIDVRWDTMRFTMTTHTAGDAVTELDFLLADRIDQIAVEHGAASPG